MKIKNILYYFLGLIFIVIFFLFFLLSGNEKINEIKIEIYNPQDNNFISNEKILKEIQIEIKGKEIKEIDLKKIKNNIEKKNIIEEAIISISPNYNMKILLKQRIPICRVFETNKSYYFDKKGEIIENDIEYSPEVFLITGKIDKENKEKIIELVNFIENDRFLKKQIIGMDINEKDEVVFTILKGTHKIYFGKIEGIEEKFLKLEVFYDKYLNSDNLSDYKVLNLKFKNQIIGEK